MIYWDLKIGYKILAGNRIWTRHLWLPNHRGAHTWTIQSTKAAIIAHIYLRVMAVSGKKRKIADYWIEILPFENLKIFDGTNNWWATHAYRRPSSFGSGCGFISSLVSCHLSKVVANWHVPDLMTGCCLLDLMAICRLWQVGVVSYFGLCEFWPVVLWKIYLWVFWCRTRNFVYSCLFDIKSNVQKSAVGPQYCVEGCIKDCCNI